MKLEHSQQINKQYSNIKFHENPSSGSRVFPFGEIAGQKNITELIIASSKFSNAPKETLNNLP